MGMDSGRGVVLLLVAIALPCCQSAESRQRLEAVERCEEAMRVGIRSRTRQDALTTYAFHCAPLYGEPACRAAVTHLSVESANPFVGPVASCLKTYCPTLSPGRVAACKTGDATPVELANLVWLDLSGAIFEREGNGDHVRLGFAILNFFADLGTRKPVRWPVDEKQADAAATRCVRGIDRALTLPTRREALRAYYDECASVYFESGCREAFETAAMSDPARQLAIVTLACRDAYCRWIPGVGPKACSPEFVPTASALDQDWPELNAAMLHLDAKGRAQELSTAAERLYGSLASRPPG